MYLYTYILLLFVFIFVVPGDPTQGLIHTRPVAYLWVTSPISNFDIFLVNAHLVVNATIQVI